MWIINVSPRGFGANTYIITADGKNAIVVDPSQPRIESELLKRELTPTHVLLTHCHFDHVGGVAPLQASGARVYCSAQEKTLVGTAADLFEAFGSPRIPYRVDETFADNEEKMLGGVSVKALVTPGHTLGSCCYLVTSIEGDRYLFTGDTLFQDSIGRTDFPTGSMAQMRASLKRLRDLDGDMPVFAGHNDETTLDIERKNNLFLQDL